MEVLVGAETLLTAESRRDERRATKAYFDAVGYYARWDAVNLNIDDSMIRLFKAIGAHRARRHTEELDVDEIAGEFDISPDLVN